ncbi:hypothetical protein CALK_2442 [Chitinivibrio alkaliphilus ACht1]|uniref:Uncharacterized protein n=1 Tax=Chitinivibrio alkaliphilus ACht1 TaxID=1313304 RepID=U7D6L6_9BACT|nr:hypothetical protein CALK_2442 [Chitinivibrio alkaliphilus ACht1]
MRSAYGSVVLEYIMVLGVWENISERQDSVGVIGTKHRFYSAGSTSEKNKGMGWKISSGHIYLLQRECIFARTLLRRYILIKKAL